MQDSPFQADDDPLAPAGSLIEHLTSAGIAAPAESHEARRTAGGASLGEAQGILMERFGIDANLAFDLLQRASKDSRRSLRAVVEDVVEGRSLSTVERGTTGR